jgi:hypothetical protein
MAAFTIGPCSRSACVNFASSAACAARRKPTRFLALAPSSIGALSTALTISPSPKSVSSALSRSGTAMFASALSLAISSGVALLPSPDRSRKLIMSMML